MKLMQKRDNIDLPNVFMRGQVWYRNNCSNGKTSSIQEGERPVLIFSSDYGNASSSFVNVIPLTSEYKPSMPINVIIKNLSGYTQVALCNQLYPCDKDELRDYQYTVSDLTMSRIEKGVMIANGLDKYIKNVDVSCSFDQLKSVIEGIVESRVNEILKDRKRNESMITIDIVNSIVDKLVEESGCKYSIKEDAHIDKRINEEISRRDKELNRELSAEEVASYGEEDDRSSHSIGSSIMKDALKNIKIDKRKSKPKSNCKPSQYITSHPPVTMAQKVHEMDKEESNLKKKNKKNKWTLDVCRQFCEDKDKLPASEMVDKYNLKDVKQVCQYYYYCKGKINKSQQGE